MNCKKKIPEVRRHYAGIINSYFLNFVIFVICIIYGGLNGEDSSSTLTNSFSLKFAPLLYGQSQNHQLYEYDAIFSLINIKRQKDIFRTRFSPVISWTSEYPENLKDKRVYFLWPLVTFKSQYRPYDDNYNANLFIFPLASWQMKQTPVTYFSATQVLPFYFHSNQGEGRKYYILFPLFWWGRDVRVFIPFYSPHRQSFFGVFPVYGRFQGLWGRDEIRFYAWPLLTTSRKKDQQAIHCPWPFVGIYRGVGGRGGKLWPLFAYVKKPNETIAQFLWPLGHYRVKLEKDTEKPREKMQVFIPFYLNVDRVNYKLRYYFPLYGREETPKRISNSYLFPLVTRTHFIKEKTSKTRILAILAQWQTPASEQGRTIREVFPLFGIDRRPHSESSYFLFPVYQYKFDEDEHVRFSRHYLIPLLISQRKEWLKETKQEKRLIVLQFFGNLQEADGSSKTRLFWLWWYTTAEPIEQLLAPLWTIFERRTDAKGNTQLTLLWHIFTARYQPDQYQWEINPFIFSYQKSCTTRETNHQLWRFSLIGGLLGFEKQKTQNTLYLFYIPLKF